MRFGGKEDWGALRRMCYIVDFSSRNSFRTLDVAETAHKISAQKNSSIRQPSKFRCILAPLTCLYWKHVVQGTGFWEARTKRWCGISQALKSFPRLSKSLTDVRKVFNLWINRHLLPVKSFCEHPSFSFYFNVHLSFSKLGIVFSSLSPSTTWRTLLFSPKEKLQSPPFWGFVRYLLL